MSLITLTKHLLSPILQLFAIVWSPKITETSGRSQIVSTNLYEHFEMHKLTAYTTTFHAMNIFLIILLFLHSILESQLCMQAHVWILLRGLRR